MNNNLSDTLRVRELEAEDIRAVVKAIVPEEKVEEALAALSKDLKTFTKPIQLESFNGLPRLTTFQGSQIRSGSAGVVVQCEDPSLKRKYALKVLRPSQLPPNLQQLEEGQEQVRREAVRGAMFTHMNVAFLAGVAGVNLPVFSGTKPSSGLKVGTTVSLLEWIDQATSFADYVYEKCSSVDQFVGLIQQLTRGIEHIHSKGLIHWDIKSANCLVNGEGIVKIVDIGNARNLREQGSCYENDEQALTSRENFPIELKGSVDGLTTDSRRITIILKAGDFTKDRMWWDLYMLGRMLSRILGFEAERDEGSTKRREEFLNRVFKPSDDDSHMALQFLFRVCQRLVKKIDQIGDAEINRYYISASMVLNDIDKLLPEFGAARDVPELHEIQQHVVRIPTTRNVPFSKRVNELTNSLLLQRLNSHAQLGLTYYSYPGVRHVRLEHTLGVLGVAIAYVKALYSDRTTPDFRIMCDSIHIRALLFAALIHDIGHGAFSHYLEEMLPLFEGCTHEDYAQALLRNDLRFCKGLVMDLDFQEARASLEENAKLWVGATVASTETISNFLKLVADILRPSESALSGSADLNDRAKTSTALLCILHSILDSSLDADKLDYLRRDAAHAGLEYANGADVDRFLQAMTVAMEPPSPDRELGRPFVPTIAVDQKGVLPLESLLLARYQMFVALYWQHTARAATTVLKYLVWQVLNPTTSRTGLNRGGQRARLLKSFRNLSDERALEWLKEELWKTHRGEDVRMRFEVLIDVVTQRKGLPFAICETSPSAFQNTVDRKQYGDLLRWHQELCNSQNIEDYAEKLGRIISGLCQRIQDGLPGEKGDLKLDDTRLFVDIPLGYKDQVENLFVVLRDDNDGAHVTSFGQHSAMAEAIQGGFRTWSRRIRIFALPDTGQRLIDLAGGAKKLSEVSYNALLGSYAEVMGGGLQQPLQGIT